MKPLIGGGWTHSELLIGKIQELKRISNILCILNLEIFIGRYPIVYQKHYCVGCITAMSVPPSEVGIATTISSIHSSRL